jgi:hypothetical protein
MSDQEVMQALWELSPPAVTQSPCKTGRRWLYSTWLDVPGFDVLLGIGLGQD